MGKITLGIFFQATITFFIGLFLTFGGIPSDQNSATILAGETIITALNQTSNDPSVNNASTNLIDSIRLTGICLTLVSIVEYILLIIKFMTQSGFY